MTDIVAELRARAQQGRFNLEAADEIERLRAELSEQCRLLGMSGERELALRAELQAAHKMALRGVEWREEAGKLRADFERLMEKHNALHIHAKALRTELDALKAWKEEVEKKEPVAWLIDWADEPDLGHYFSESAVDEDSGRSRPLFLHPVPVQSVPHVDALAQFIREIDGAHRFGAGALAERTVECLTASPKPEVK